jgi:ferritin
MTEDSDLLQLANEAMELEYNISKLYMIFRDSHPEDAEFWWKLVLEESNHAALIKSGLDYFMPEGVFPYEIFPSMDDLQEANKELRSLLSKYATHPPSRDIALNIALKTEISAGEIHFQRAMTKSTDSEIMQLFRTLNQDDKDHAKRIRVYMKEKGIEESG